MHLSLGRYRLDVAQRTIRRIAKVMQGYEWFNNTEPASFEEMAVRLLPEDEQLMVDVLDV